MTGAYAGRCHCGAIEVVLESAKSPDELGVRACDCSFCRGHGARTTSDNGGRARITARAASRLQRYQFGLRTADFLICRDCGAYMGAYFEAEDGRGYATLNTRWFEAAGDFPEAATPAHYQSETAEHRVRRRLGLWTPTVIQD